jgi:hypothetical protein
VVETRGKKLRKVILIIKLQKNPRLKPEVFLTQNVPPGEENLLRYI